MIHTLPAPCWYVQYPDGSDTSVGGDPQPHYDSPAEARHAAEEQTTDEERPAGFYRIAQYDEPCVLVSCNECRKDVDSDEWSVVHFPDVAIAAEMADAADFTVVGLAAWCSNCKTKTHTVIPDPAVTGNCLRCPYPVEDHEPAAVSP